MEVSGQPHTPATLAQGKNPNKHWGAGWVSSRTGLEKSLALARYNNVNQPAHSFVYTKHSIKFIYIKFWKVKTCTVEPRSIVPATIVFPHVLFAIFGPEWSSI